MSIAITRLYHISHVAQLSTKKDIIKGEYVYGLCEHAIGLSLLKERIRDYGDFFQFQFSFQQVCAL